MTAKSCQRCGAGFGCSPEGGCWCSHEPFRMPMPEKQATPYDDCLCPDCLRAVAAELGLAPEPGAGEII